MKTIMDIMDRAALKANDIASRMKEHKWTRWIGFGLAPLLLAKGASAQVGVINPLGEDVSLITLINQIILIAAVLVGIIAVIYLIISGFRYVTSGGNEEDVKKAKEGILNAIIGIIIVFASYVIVSFIINGFLGVDNDKFSITNADDSTYTVPPELQNPTGGQQP